MNDAENPDPPASPPTPQPEDFEGSPADRPPPRRRNPAVRVVATLAVIVSVVIAGTVTVWAIDRPGVLPENILPAEGVNTFVRLDYDPALAQAFTAYRFNDAYQAAADLNPSRADLSAGPLGWLFGPMLDGTGMTVRSDVDGWVGDKAGVMILDSGTVLVAVKLDGDENQVRDFFVEYARTAGITVGYTFERGYVVISDSSADAERATLLAAQGGDLGGDPGFVADLQRLPSARLGVAWTKLGSFPERRDDFTFSGRVMTTLDREVGGLASLVRGVLEAGSLADQVYAEAATASIDGRLVVGLTMRTDGIAVDGFVGGLTVNGQFAGGPPAGEELVAPLAETSAAPAGPQGLFELRAVPADTVLAVGFKGLGGALLALTPQPGPAVDAALALVGADTAIGVLGGGGIVVRAAGTDPAAVAEAVTAATGQELADVVGERSSTGTTSLVTTGEVADLTPLDNIPTFADALPALDDALAAFYVNLDWATFTQDVDSLGPYSSFGIGVSKGPEPGEFEFSGRLLIDELYVVPQVPDVLPSAPASGNPSAEPTGAVPGTAASSDPASAPAG